MVGRERPCGLGLARARAVPHGNPGGVHDRMALPYDTACVHPAGAVPAGPNLPATHGPMPWGRHAPAVRRRCPACAARSWSTMRLPALPGSCAHVRPLRCRPSGMPASSRRSPALHGRSHGPSGAGWIVYARASRFGRFDARLGRAVDDGGRCVAHHGPGGRRGVSSGSRGASAGGQPERRSRSTAWLQDAGSSAWVGVSRERRYLMYQILLRYLGAPRRPPAKTEEDVP